MVTWTSVAASWGTFGGIVILGWWYYTRDGKRRQGSSVFNRTTDRSVPEYTDRRQSSNRPKQHKKDKERDPKPSGLDSSDVAQDETIEVGTSKTSDKHLQQRKKGAKQRYIPLGESSAVSTSPTKVASNTQDNEEESDAREFARRMAKAKAGTILSGPQKTNQRVKTQKQSKVNGVLGEFGSAASTESGTSSNVGADADNNSSPLVSPSLQATTGSVDACGVSDMLETPEPGPSSLRITEPTQPQRALQPKQAKKVEPVETKKQRQARARREREKEAQRETEAQRKVLEEKQRRTAREAEGRPAKNGNGWTYSSGLPANAWSQSNAAAPTPKPTVDAPLLDTGETSGNAEGANENADLATGVEKNMNIIQPNLNTPATNGSGLGSAKSISKASSSSTSSNHWGNNLPSEEEQMRIFDEQSKDADWTTVPTNKRAKRHEAPEEKEKAPNAQKEAPDFDVTI
ncbi:MAG: hypothetical protein LQ340_001696 [Diploschistes diacapsis]|nr:MAG: hypothetical protein LQ340_001696 [Diploschistes diacapsis]